MARKTRDDLARVAEETANEARSNCPVDTGTLRDSIAVVSGKNEAGQFEVSITADAEYAAFVELGTSKRTAIPFLRPALAGVPARLEKAVKK